MDGNTAEQLQSGVQSQGGARSPEGAAEAGRLQDYEGMGEAQQELGRYFGFYNGEHLRWFKTLLWFSVVAGLPEMRG